MKTLTPDELLLFAARNAINAFADRRPVGTLADVIAFVQEDESPARLCLDFHRFRIEKNPAATEAAMDMILLQVRAMGFSACKDGGGSGVHGPIKRYILMPRPDCGLAAIK